MKAFHTSPFISLGVSCLALLSLNGMAAPGGPSFTEKPLADVGWHLNYTGSTYDALSNTTTFSYLLTAANWEKNLSHWVLELADAPISSTGCALTTNGLDPTTGVSGWKCDDGQNAGTTQGYSITVSGHIGEAPTAYSVKGGTYFAIGGTTGPGAPIATNLTYSISGIAFLDANGNGVLDSGEPLLQNTTVMLDTGQTMKTAEDGSFLFGNLLAGRYTLSIPGSTPGISDDFNEALSQYFLPTTSTSLGLSVGPNATNQNFGFNLDTEAVLADFDASDPDADGFTFSGTGKTIGFWKHQVTSAKQGKTKGVQVSSAAVRDYLYSGTTSIKTLYLDVFGDIPAAVPGAYDYALAILGSTSSNATDLLKKQLLGTELNMQAGLGISNSMLQGVLLAWSEYLVKHADTASRDQLLDAKDICDLINNTGE